MSSGRTVRGSMTSQSMPCASRASAASSAKCTVRPMATIVTSAPSFMMRALPNGIVYSSSGTFHLSWM